MEFKVNSTVVHALHGLGTVEGIQDRDILGQRLRFATVFFPDDCLRVMINIGQENDFIRPAMTRAEAEMVLEHLASYDSDAPNRSSWRQKHHLRKIKTGVAQELSEVVKGLSPLSAEKRLNKREESMYRRARAILASEMGYALSVAREEAERRIDRACGVEASQAEEKTSVA